MEWLRRACLVILVIPAMLASAAIPARSAWSVVGTTVQADEITPVPDVRITIYPDSLTSASDANGDFIVSWSGARAWLLFIPPEPRPDGKPWCKRYALYPRAAAAADSTLDIGLIRITPKLLGADPLQPLPPKGVEVIPRLRIPGPKEGEPARYWQMLRFRADIWGRTTRVEDMEGDPKPQPVHDALRRHLQEISWIVPDESRCEEADPFSNVLTFMYQWQDSVWVPKVSWGPPANPPLGPRAVARPDTFHAPAPRPSR